MYPVHYLVTPPARFTRLGLAIRIVAFLAIGTIGIPFGAVLLFIYLALPAFAASRLASGVAPEAYLREDAPRILRALHWFAAVMAWAGLVVDRLPTRAPAEVVTLAVEGDAHPTAGSAALRVLAGIPSALVLLLLSCVGVLVWIWAALSVLFVERIGPHALGFLTGLQRWTMRLLVYQASLVDAYPPFSFEDAAAAPRMPEASAH